MITNTASFIIVKIVIGIFMLIGKIGIRKKLQDGESIHIYFRSLPFIVIGYDLLTIFTYPMTLSEKIMHNIPLLFYLFGEIVLLLLIMLARKILLLIRFNSCLKHFETFSTEEVLYLNEKTFFIIISITKGFEIKMNKIYVHLKSRENSFDFDAQFVSNELVPQTREVLVQIFSTISGIIEERRRILKLEEEAYKTGVKEDQDTIKMRHHVENMKTEFKEKYNFNI